MDVLVSTASKHGGTTGIGEVIADELTARGLSASLVAAESVTDLGDYDAFVLGSAVYAGRWQKSARALVDQLAPELRARPVWLFSSGPVGSPPQPVADPVDVAEITAAVAARDHRVFAGRLLQSSLSFGERAIVAALRAEYGDFRDWDEIRAWAAAIASDLTSPPPESEPR